MEILGLFMLGDSELLSNLGSLDIHRFPDFHGEPHFKPSSTNAEICDEVLRQAGEELLGSEIGQRRKRKRKNKKRHTSELHTLLYLFHLLSIGMNPIVVHVLHCYALSMLY
ncbi:hypothetical protein Syun_017734 [Stephania yunnanensis]|uniref:Uncharacterized protein n=1 Tax=Stephania yunnanensis TaxID=152371 RepID=A0AAP0J740_9MAGN